MEQNLLQTRPPKNYLVEPILVTLLCCLPFGIAGIVNVSKVESRHIAGDTEGALRAASEAKKWTTIGFIISLVTLIGYGIFMAFFAKNLIDNPEFMDQLKNK